MSVINQVLRELEKRRALGAERGAVPDHVRALPGNGGAGSGWPIAGAVFAAASLVALAGVLLSGAGWLRAGAGAPTLQPGPDPVIERVVTASAPVVAGIAPREDAGESPRAAPVLAGRLTLELASAPAPAASVEPVRREAASRDPIPAARVLARAENGERAERVEVPAGAEAPRAAVTREKAATAPARSAAGRAPAAEKAADAPEVNIEKKLRQPTPRDLADGEYRRAAAALHQGRSQEAQEGFRAAIQHNPAHHGARQALAALLVESRAHAEAERVLQEGVRLAPEQIGFAMTLARLQVDRGDPGGAIATLQGGAAHAQGSPDYIAFLAALLQRQGRHEDAIPRFQAALQAKPANGVWWLGLGVSLQALGRAADAHEAFRRARSSSNLSPELAAFADQRLRQLQ